MKMNKIINKKTYKIIGENNEREVFLLIYFFLCDIFNNYFLIINYQKSNK